MSNNIAKSALWVTISEIIFNLSGYIIHSVVGRILGPADYGRYGLVVTLTTMVIILIGNGIPTAMSKYISEIFETNASLVKKIKGQAVILQTILIGSITVLFFLSAPLISRILGDPSLTKLFRISTLIIPAFAMASFYFSYYTGLHKFNIQSILKTIRSLLKVGAIIALAYLYKVEGSIIGYALAAFLVFAVAFIIDKFYIDRKLKERIKEEDNPVFDYKKLLNYAWQVIVFFLAYELLISIDLYLVKGILQDDYQTGIYNAALTVGRIPYYIFYALTVILLPVISKSTAEKNNEKTNQIIGQSLRIMVILLVPSVILMAQFARPIIRIFYSSQYIDAALPMSILAYGVGFLTIFYVMSFVMNGAGKTKVPMWISIFGVIFNAILNYFLIKKYGIVGSSIATSIASFITMWIMIYFLYKDFGVLMRAQSVIKIIFAGILTYIASLFFPKMEILFIVWSIILFFFYLFILYAIKEIKKEDFEIIKNIIKRKNKKEAQEELSGNEPGA